MTTSLGTVSSPAFNDTVEAGSDVMVVWEYTANVQGSAFVDIELRDGVTGTPLHTVATRVPNHGYYFWSVDSRLRSGCNRVLYIGNLLEANTTGLLSSAFNVARPASRSSATTRGSSSARPPAWSVSHESGAIDELQVSFSNMSVDSSDSSKDNAANATPRSPVQHAVSRATAARSRRVRSPRPPPALLTASTSLPGSRVHRSIDGGVLWSEYPDFIYWAIHMDATTIRRCLRAIVKDRDVTADSVLHTGDSAGIFCVKYLLMLYYKKRLAQSLEQSIVNGEYAPNPELVDAWRRTRMAQTAPQQRLASIPIAPTPVTSPVTSPVQTRMATRSATRQRVQHLRESTTSSSSSLPVHRLRPPRRRRVGA